MLGLLLTLAFCCILAAAVAGILRPLFLTLDPAERWGVALMVGMWAMGTLTFFVGILPGGLRWGLWIAPLLVLVIAVLKGRLIAELWHRPKVPSGLGVGALLLVELLSLVPLVNALAPSDTMDWDTLAYHFAVPKLWLQAGQIVDVPFIHHSHFPFAIDNLYLYGLSVGSESAAKAVTLAGFMGGLLALFGVARRMAGTHAAWTAALVWAGAPVILWTSGSGYIDAVHGLYVGMAVIYGAQALQDRPMWKLSFLMLAGAAATKWTGLQTAFALSLCALVWIPGSFRTRMSPAIAVAVIAGLACSPWAVRNVVLTGNPVYPFFYERLGGKNWDDWRAAIYRDEQQTFGIGRTESGRDWSQFPSAVLGLAYQPGRYINPQQTQGGGFPMGAVGFVAIAVWAVWLAAGRRIGGRETGFVLNYALIGLLMWFVLSQQSRYIAGLTAVAAVWAGLAVARIPWAKWFAGAAVLQAVYSLWLLVTIQTARQLPVVTGSISRDAYLTRQSGFWPASQAINQLPKGSEVALYDEVFGYYLDVSYFWANPGHSTLVRYDQADTGADLVRALADQGITHVYLNTQYQSPEFMGRWSEAMRGLRPWSPEEKQQMDSDLNLKWKRLLADAFAEQHLQVVQAFRNGLLFEVKRP